MTHQNRLAKETSPYLLQHAENPVDWYPWGDEAFARASEEDKPVFLSIGYSTCHWCHVMAHESFADPEIASLINEHFIAIKVDREERPDIDAIYMTVCQAMTGSGGWPLTLILTPEKQPFFAATYIPPHTTTTMRGLADLIPEIAKIWETDRDRITTTSKEIMRHLQNHLNTPIPHRRAVPTTHFAFDALKRQYDVTNGGFSGAPKFPLPQNILFLLRHYASTGNEVALQMAEQTIRAIRRGGICDHLGFGLHRYATDEKWRIPHFEKMLYDQALFVLACTACFQVTGNPFYETVIREVLSYVQQDLTLPNGVFCTAEDADSAGAEGTFYLWKVEEIDEILPPREAARAKTYWNITPEGTPGPLPAGENVPAILPDVEAPEDINSIRRTLLAFRESRERPFRDDKILTDWNGLMIAAFARAAFVLDEPAYLETASRAAETIFTHLLRDDGRLWHAFRDGQAKTNGTLDDYAFLTWGVLELYGASFDPAYLRQAIHLTKTMTENLYDTENGGFYFTSHDEENLLFRQKSSADSAIPSGNAIAMQNLLRLFDLTGNHKYYDQATATIAAFSKEIHQNPAAHISFFIPAQRAATSGKTITITQSGPTSSFLDAIRQEYLPEITIIVKNHKNAKKLGEILPFTHEMPLTEDTAMLCEKNTCHRQVQTPEELLRILREDKHGGFPEKYPNQ